MLVVLFIVIGIVALSIPALLAARLAAAKRREQRVGAPSTFTKAPDEVTEDTSPVRHRR